VVIEGSKIKAVGKDVSIPEGAEVIDARGKTVMPGLIDSHVHIMGSRGGAAPMEMMSRPPELALIRSIDQAKDMLAAGFTTTKDCGGRNAIFLKKAVAEGTLTSLPRIIAAGYTLSQTYGHGDTHHLPVECVDARTSNHFSAGTLLCDGVNECIKATRYSLRNSADFIKCHTTGGIGSERDKPSQVQFNLDEIKAIVETAAQADKFVTAHCESSLKAIKQSIIGGIKTIDHAFVSDEECIELAIEKGAIFVTTLSIIRMVRAVDAGNEAMKGFPIWMLEKMRPELESMVESYKRIHKGGATLALGTDTVGAQVLIHGTNAMELELMVTECDFTPMEAIVTATKNGAMACFMGDETGTIEPGKFADIIIIDGNPLADIKILQDLEKIKMVMLEGKIEIRRQ